MISWGAVPTCLPSISQAQWPVKWSSVLVMSCFFPFHDFDTSTSTGTSALVYWCALVCTGVHWCVLVYCCMAASQQAQWQVKWSSVLVMSCFFPFHDFDTSTSTGTSALVYWCARWVALRRWWVTLDIMGWPCRLVYHYQPCHRRNGR